MAKNVFQGLGYLGEKLAVGFMQTTEGIWDYSASGLAKMFGGDDWAERQIKNDWFGDWYSRPDEKFDATGGWKVAGDIAGGIGTSLPASLAALGAVALTVYTGGAGAGASAGLLSAVSGATAFTVGGLGAAGNATKEAYRETGELGSKEYGYGAMVGLTEGALEGVSNVIGVGTGAVASSAAKALGKSTATTATKSLAKSSSKSLLKTLGKNFASEAFEEGLSEAIDPVYKRLTYDPNAQNASAQEIAYAAFVGGMSGMIMGSAQPTVSSGYSLVKGTRINSKGEAGQVIDTAKLLADRESVNESGDESMKSLSDTYNKLANSLNATGGQIKTIQQKKWLGDLSRMNVSNTVVNYVSDRALDIVSNPEAIVERINSYGYKTADGKVLNYTVEQLTEGYDPKNPKSIHKAIKKNALLRELAVADAAGRLVMDYSKFARASMMGEALATQTDLNRFLANASPKEINAVSQVLEIDDWSTLDADTFNAKIINFAENGGVDAYAAREALVKKLESIPSESAKPIPNAVSFNTDGSIRYADADTHIAISKEGDAYTFYNYDTRELSKNLTEAEVNEYLKSYSEQKGTKNTTSELDAAPSLKSQDSDIDSYARENIPEYKKLNDPNQMMIRKIIREGRAKGLSDEDVLTYAKVAAHSGLNVVFDKEAAVVYTEEDGKRYKGYSDGFYDRSQNRIVVNPEATRNDEKLLIHELEHAILKGKKGDKLIKIAFDNMSEKQREHITNRYGKFYKNKGLTPAQKIEIFNDEISAHFGEEVLSKKQLLEMLTTEEPTLKDKMLSFFKKASSDYSADAPKLSKAAKKYYNTYKKLFAEFSARNRGSNALTADTASVGTKTLSAATNAGVDTDTRFALLTDEDLAEYMATGKTLHTRHKKQRMLENGKKPILTSESEIREFISNAIQGKAGGEVRAFARVPKRLAEAISDVRSTLNLEGDYLEFQADALREAYKVHSSPKMQGDIALSESDFENLHRHIFDFDGVLSVNDYNGKTEVHIYRRTENGYYQIITVSSSERRSLQITKLIGVSKEKFEEKYAKKIERNTGSPRMLDASNPSTKARHTAGALSTVIIPETEGKSNPSDENSSKNPPKKRYALPESDSTGAELTSDQRKYFDTSKQLDSEGRLQVMYQGAPEEFFTFDKKKSKASNLYGRGFYFTNSADQARHYGTVRGYYLNITNPLSATKKTISRMKMRKFLNAVAENEDYSIENYGTYDVAEVLRSVYEGKSDFAMLYDVSLTAIGDLVEAVELFNEINGTEYDGFILDTESVIFRSEQAKLTSNSTPSNNPDTRYALTDDAKVMYNLRQENNLHNGDAKYEQDNQNAGVLERGAVSTIDRNGNHVRNSGKNTTNAVAGMESSSNVWKDNVGYALHQRNSSGYLGRTDIDSPYSYKRLTERILRNWEGKLAARDASGRKLSEHIKSKFSDTVFKNEKGELLSVFHWTPNIFQNFSKGDIGFHFGTYKAAQDRKKSKPKHQIGHDITKEVYLNIKNPIFLEDFGHWDVYDISTQLWERGLISYDELNELQHKKGAIDGTYNDEANIALRKLLQNLNYDGIVYKNIVEDKGTLSVVALYPEQIHTVAENGIDIDKKQYASDPVIRYALSPTLDSVTTTIDESYKPTLKDKAFSGLTSLQIAFTNEQAGIEKVAKIYGIKNMDALVQSARSGGNQADEMIGGNQWRIGAEEKTYQGEGLEKIFRPINNRGDDVKKQFFDYLFHYHNMSRMTLEQRSMAEQAARLDDIKDKTSKYKKLIKSIEKLQADIKALGRSKADLEAKAKLREDLAIKKEEAKSLRKEISAVTKEAKEFVPLENKAVFGVKDENGVETPVTAEESSEIIKEYEKAYPEFKETAEKVWQFLKNLNQYRVDTGLISQDTYDYLEKLYPNYVPTYRTGATKGIAAIGGKYNLAVKPTIKRAKGSTDELLPIDVMISRQVMETVRAGRINQIANALYEGAEKSGDSTYIEIVSRKRVSNQEIADIDPTELRPKNNEITFFRNGEKITIRVSKEVFAGFDAFNPRSEIINPAVKALERINKEFKRLVTSANPAFLIRNSVRDLQDAGINTKYGIAFLKNYEKAIEEIASNGEMWQLYKAMGGLSSSIFDFDKGYDGSQNKFGLTKGEGFLGVTLQAIENANTVVEQLPRLAEFICSIKAGNTAEQAILDAADVTTNFARTGKITKVLNRTLIPFLNAAIQGSSKAIRNITSIRTAKAAAMLVFKAAIIGVAPMVLNMIMYGDDEDYAILRDTDKENYFLIKLGKNFLKIPRGRVASVLGGLTNRTWSVIEGEDADWAGFIKNASQQITPVDSASRTIFSPLLRDLPTNTTWYGSDIEGRQFENTAPKDRYDENTSSIAIAIGQIINYSPKKIHYLLDQYSGVIGDVLLPATTSKKERDFFSGNFTIDPATSNELSTKFYEIYDKTQYAKTAGDDTSIYQIKYLNKVKESANDMYKEKSRIQNSDLKGAEKLQQTRVVQLLINEVYKTAMQDFEVYTKAVEATASIKDEKLRYTETLHLMYGAERALSEYNDDVYAKSQLLNKAGLGYEDFYNYYFTVRDIESEKDSDGNTVSGSKRKKVVSAIKKMNISADEKLLLISTTGYTLKDNDVGSLSADAAKKRLIKYILSLKVSQSEKIKIAEACGFKVKNGKIIMDTDTSAE